MRRCAWCGADHLTLDDRYRDEQASLDQAIADALAEGQRSLAKRLSKGPGGQHVVFSSEATNLVAGDSNGKKDVFVRDLEHGETIRANLSSSGEQANEDSYYPGISEDGRFVCFASSASNLVDGDTNEMPDIFVRDLAQGKTALVSSAPGGVAADGGSYWPVISGNGRYIAFVSEARNLIPGGIGNADVTQVYLAPNPLLQ